MSLIVLNPDSAILDTSKDAPATEDPDALEVLAYARVFVVGSGNGRRNIEPKPLGMTSRSVSSGMKLAHCVIRSNFVLTNADVSTLLAASTSNKG